MKGKEGFGYFKGRKKNQKKCELAKKLRVGLIKKLLVNIIQLNKEPTEPSLNTTRPAHRLHPLHSLESRVDEAPAASKFLLPNPTKARTGTVSTSVYSGEGLGFWPKC